MRNNEFKSLYNNMVEDFAKCSTLAEYNVTFEKYDDIVCDINTKLTDNQWKTFHELWDAQQAICDMIISKENKTMGKTNEEVKNELVTSGETAPATDDKKINAAVARIEKKIGTIEKGYLSIIGDVAYLAENDGAKALGYKNIYELCADKFGMARGTVHNLLSIYKRFGDGNYGLTDEANGLGVRAMLSQIKNEADARKALEDNGGATVTDGYSDDEDSENASKDSKAKVDVIDFDFTNADKWSVDDLLEKIREELEAGGITDVDANSNIIFKITH